MATIGVDLGGTNVRAALIADDGTVLNRVHRRTAASNREQLLTDLFEAIDSFLPGGHGCAIGIGVAGMIGRDGVVHASPNIPALAGVDLAGAVRERRESAVCVENDANAAAWGEYRFGALQDAQNALVVTLGTGIGGGIIVNGALMRGAHGFAAEIGHFHFESSERICACGEPGHWEAHASGSALGVLGSERYGEVVTGVALAQRFANGEPIAREVMAEYIEQVAMGCAGLINIFDPEVLALSGGLVSIGDEFVQEIATRTLAAVEAPHTRRTVHVCGAHLGSDAGMIGSAALAREFAT